MSDYIAELELARVHSARWAAACSKAGDAFGARIALDRVERITRMIDRERAVSVGERQGGEHE